MLSAILRQNPRFLAGMTSPVASLALPLLQRMGAASEFASFFSDDARRSIMRSVFDGYYQPPRRRPVIFDTNRVWCGKTALLAEVFPRSRIICCVRELGWILDSVERLLDKNPLQPSKILDAKALNGTVYARVETMMNVETGFIGVPYSNLRKAWFGNHAGRLIIVSYEGLSRDPSSALARLYDTLEQPRFTHDFANVRYDEPEYDADLGMPGLHTVRPSVSHDVRNACIPPDLFAKYPPQSCFWRVEAPAPVASGPDTRRPVIVC